MGHSRPPVLAVDADIDSDLTILSLKVGGNLRGEYYCAYSIISVMFCSRLLSDINHCFLIYYGVANTGAKVVIE